MTNAISNRDLEAVDRRTDGGAETIGPVDASRALPVRLAFGAVLAVAAGLVVAGVVFKPQTASALPSYARQTGQPCATCHTAFPELTPFGRRFKLGGYTMGGGMTFDEAPPIAAMIMGPEFAHFVKNQDAPPAPGLHTNDNVVLGQASLFYGGQIYGNLGAFIQGTYDGVGQSFALDNTDIRYADTAKLFGIDLIWGVTANNNPTVQDVWNTTPAWGFPFITSQVPPQFSPPGTMIEGAFAAKVVGTGVYTFWKDMLYIELSAYQNLSAATLQALGVDNGGPFLSGAAPYWRIAIEPTFGEHSLMIGTFGMLANIYPGYVPGAVSGFGTDRILDLGFDAQYQYISDVHAVTLKLTDIYETQTLNSSFAQGGIASNPTDTLNTFHATVSYVYDRTYSLTGSYFDVRGSSDALIYGANSINGSPNGNGFIVDAAYLPFSKGGPSFYPWFNVRLGVSYTAYLKLNGASTNFDGLGHNASDNNTILLYSWIMF
jgi:hypothetical protein